MHKLALRMGKPVSELSAILTMGELVDWVAYDRITPIGDEKFDWLFAQLCSVVASSSGAKKKSGGTFSVQDFLMFKREKEKSVLEAMKGWLGARVVKGKPKWSSS